jgi:hypothetical protein
MPARGSEQRCALLGTANDAVRRRHRSTDADHHSAQPATEARSRNDPAFFNCRRSAAARGDLDCHFRRCQKNNRGEVGRARDSVHINDGKKDQQQKADVHQQCPRTATKT